MPSPFPGMDPFLEEHWGDVHTRLTTYACDQLQPLLPETLVARIEEFVHLVADDQTRREPRAPDIHVSEVGSTAVAVAKRMRKSRKTAAKPLVVPRREQWTERWIQITDRNNSRLVTSIEFLSPGNKDADGRKEFRKKQQQMLAGGVNLVEIDLIRRGPWVLSVPRLSVPDSHSYPYRICVVRAHQSESAECYPVPLRDPLPAISIPLRPGDDDVLLELQPLIELAWKRGRYSSIDYTKAPHPRFRSEDEAWIKKRIQEWSATHHQSARE